MRIIDSQVRLYLSNLVPVLSYIQHLLREMRLIKYINENKKYIYKNTYICISIQKKIYICIHVYTLY